MTNTNFEGAETSNSGDFTTSNDFRRVCIIKDPDCRRFSCNGCNTKRNICNFNSSPGSGSFTVDEKITQATTGVGKVVEHDTTNNILYYMQTRFNNAGLDSNGKCNCVLRCKHNYWCRVQV